MIKNITVSVLTIMLLSAPVAAQRQSPRPAESERLNAIEADVDAAKLQARDLDRRVAVLDGQFQVSGDAYSRFENEISTFGILITLLVLGFGFLTHRGAVNAARHELSEMRDKVELLHVQAVSAKEQADLAAAAAREAAASAQEAAAAAHRAAEGAKAHEQNAELSSEKVKEAVALAERWTATSAEQRNSEMTSAERETVADAARQVEETPQRDWSIDEFKLKMFQEESLQNWPALLHLSQGLSFLHGHNKKALADALFSRALALTRMRRHAEALAAYDELMFRLDQEKDDQVLPWLARGMVNKAILLGEIERWEDSVEISDKVIERFDKLTGVLYHGQVLKAASQKAISLLRLGQAAAARDALVSAVARYDTSGDRKIDEETWYNLACVHAVNGDVNKSMQALDKWSAIRGEFNCAEVAADTDFDVIRGQPAFSAYLKQKGCGEEA